MRLPAASRAMCENSDDLLDKSVLTLVLQPNIIQLNTIQQVLQQKFTLYNISTTDWSNPNLSGEVVSNY